MTLNPWRLRLLEALDRVGTVRAVAAEQRLAPSTVSEQLALLEAEVRTPLVERSGRRLRLTPAGRLLATRGRELLDHMDSIESELAELAAEPVGHIRVASFASALTSLVFPAAVALSRSHPRLALELLELEPHESVEAVRRGDCEVAVTFDQEDMTLDQEGGSPPLTGGVVGQALARDPLLVLLPRDHRLAGQPTVRLADLAAEPWALDREGTYLGRLVPALCRRNGFEPIVRGRFTSVDLVAAAVECGLGVAILPKLAFSEHRRAVASARVEGLGERRIWLAMRAGVRRRVAIQTLVVALRAQAAALGHVAG
ncbi:MAG: LysR family transcriptional regulator [Micromonosporaceae bacterium]|nr:LysR family transcriptional regulator [Micromonosporaceae bacterium]